MGKKHNNTNHCKSRQPTYRSWDSMRRRCLNQNSDAFKYYGGRGIIICDQWINNFNNFLADMGERPKELTLERINNNGNYTPENCRWATRKEQAINRHTTRFFTHDDKTLTMSQWAKVIGVSRQTLRRRYNIVGNDMEKLFRKKKYQKL